MDRSKEKFLLFMAKNFIRVTRYFKFPLYEDRKVGKKIIREEKRERKKERKKER